MNEEASELSDDELEDVAGGMSEAGEWLLGLAFV